MSTNGAKLTNAGSDMFGNFEAQEAVIKAGLFTISAEGVWGIPTILKGKPGIAKSSIVRQVSIKNGLACITVLPNIREPSDLALGLPYLDKTESKAGTKVNGFNYEPPKWAKLAVQLAPCVVFFDEGNAAPSIQNAMLRVSLERVAGDLVLPESVRVLMAMNPTGQSAGGSDLSAALANRYMHLHFRGPSGHEWADHLESNPVRLAARPKDGIDVVPAKDPKDAEKLQAKVILEWEQQYAIASGLFSTYMRARPTMIHQQPEEEDARASEAWASARSWKDATCWYAGAKIHGLKDVELAAGLTGLLGATAKDFIVWLRTQDVVNPADLLDGKVKFEHNAERLDRTIATLSGCVSFLADTNIKDREVRAAAFWKLLRDLIPHGKDLITPATKTLIRSGLRLRGNNDSIEVMAAVSKTMELSAQFNR